MSNLPKGWIEKKLGEICTITSSKRIFQSEYTPNGIPFYRTKEIKELANDKDVTTELFISEQRYKEIKVNFGIPIEGDMLLTAIGTIGEIYIVEKDKEFYFKDGNVLWLKDFKSVNTYYLKFALRIFIEQIKKLSNGSTYNALPIEKLKKHKISLPPLEEQKRIAEILEQAEELRTKRREAIAQLDTLTQSIFIEMFGDPVRNPKEWVKMPFGEVCVTRLGKMLDKQKQTGEYRRMYLRNANVQWFRFNLTDIFEMDFRASECEILRLQYGDLLICEGGEPGRAAIWRDEIPECYYQKTLHRARPKHDLANSEYLAYLLWLLSKGGGLNDHITSSTISHLTGEKLKVMKIPIPPIDIQQKFTHRIEAVESLKAAHRASLSELDALFDSLQHRAFKGDL